MCSKSLAWLSMLSKQTKQNKKQTKTKQWENENYNKIFPSSNVHKDTIVMKADTFTWFFGTHTHVLCCTCVCIYVVARGQSLMFLRRHLPCFVTQGQSSRHVACQLCLAVLPASSLDASPSTFPGQRLQVPISKTSLFSFQCEFWRSEPQSLHSNFLATELSLEPAIS